MASSSRDYKTLLGMVPGTGRPFRIAGAYHVRVRDGRIIEHASVEDALSLMAQVQPRP